MNAHVYDCLAGVWGALFERGLVDRLLDAATAARDAAEAVTAAEVAAWLADGQSARPARRWVAATGPP